MAEDIQIIDANTMFGIHPRHSLDMSVERLMKDMDKYRVTAGLTLSTVGIFHDHTKGNAMTIETSKANKCFVPVATVNPKAYFGSAADMQAIRDQGFRIFKFHPDEQGWGIGSAAFGEILKQLSPLKSPIMLDTSHPGEPSEVGRMISDYPAPVILCSISLDVFSEVLAVMSAHSNVMLETNELHVPGALKMLVDRVGADRIVYGSGAPRCSISSSLQYVLNSELSDEDKEHILSGNIKRILEAS